MSRTAWATGLLAFVLTLLLNLPASWVLRGFAWPPGWQPEQVSGTLWRGRIERLGAFAPLQWQLDPLATEARLQAGFAQQSWMLLLEGWPWRWQARLQPQLEAPGVMGDYLIDGRWQGSLHLQGRGLRCLSGEGELRGEQVAMLAPWTLALGQVRLHPQCQQALHLLVDVQHTEHRIQARLAVPGGRTTVSGELQPGAALVPLLNQAGWLKGASGPFEAILGKR